MFPATVMETAAAFGQKRVQEEFALKGTEGGHPQGDRLEVLSGLLLVPGAGPWREFLQAHRSAHTMAGDTAGVALALRQEDRLYLCPEELEIQN